MAKDRPFPVVPLSLLEHLEWVSFRDRLPTQSIEVAEFARLQGQQDVIRKLRSEFERQSKNILTPTE